MPQKDQLTTQRVRSLFKSSFDLATYAIRVARLQIRAGEEVTVPKLLAEIVKNPHKYDLAAPESLKDIEEEDTLDA